MKEGNGAGLSLTVLGLKMSRQRLVLPGSCARMVHTLHNLEIMNQLQANSIPIMDHLEEGITQLTVLLTLSVMWELINLHYMVRDAINASKAQFVMNKELDSSLQVIILAQLEKFAMLVQKI